MNVRRATALAACALIVSACGSNQHVDGGGFTGSQRAAAQAALDLLQRTGIPRTVVAISYRSGQAPATCTVLPVPGTPTAFTLIVAWGQPRPGYTSVPQSVLQGTIGGASVSDVRYSVTSFGGAVPEPATVKATLVRAALSKPAEQCDVLEDGHLQLASSH